MISLPPPRPVPIDTTSWKRKNAFQFFIGYDQPFFNLCSEVEVTQAKQKAKEAGLSFFQLSLFLSLKAVNQVEAFRYRLRQGKPIAYELIHGGSTILNQDNSFSFAYFPFVPDFPGFSANCRTILDHVHQAEQGMDALDDRDDLIHYSVLPWIRFTGLMHARQQRADDAIPKIVFGKIHQQESRLMMPIAIDVHHALMDGYHVGVHLNVFQELLNTWTP